MPASNYPNGFANGITIRGIPITQAHPGQVFWVSNAAAAQLAGHKSSSNGNKGTFDAPYATIAYALSQCKAGRGDIIMIKPGHAENIGAAAALACSVAGVAFVGLGSGSAVPTLSWTAAAATITVTAANVSFVNMKFVNNFANVVTMFAVAATGDGLSFENCIWTDTSTILNAIDFITLTTGADDLWFSDCRVVGKSASNDSFVKGVAHDGFRMQNCHLQFDVAQTSVVGLLIASGNVTNAWIKDSLFRSNIDGAVFIDFDGTACSGGVTNCYFSSLDVAGAVTAGFDFTGGHIFECYVAGEPDTYGIIGGGSAYNNA
jgi:hypothetical protein